MEDTRRLILTHLSLYPGMELEDCFKLLYQGALGGGHLIEDETAFALRLKEELEAPGVFAFGPAGPEALGGGFVRVYLSAFANGPGVKTLAALCAQSARRAAGGMERLLQKLGLLAAMAGEGLLPWPRREVEELTARYAARGWPPPRHSARYTALYRPHYRVLEAGAALFLPVFAAIDAALCQKPYVLAGIDGMCGSGKSSLAALLAQVYGCGVLHADDFFLRPVQRTPERLAAPGGNIDSERLAAVLAQAAAGAGFSYRPYNCQTGNLGPPVTAEAGPLTLAEGAYCLHPALAAPYDVRVFLYTSAAVQARRIVKRNGEEAARRFQNEWIPMENRYFSAFGIREGCTLALDTGGLG